LFPLVSFRLSPGRVNVPAFVAHAVCEKLSMWTVSACWPNTALMVVMGLSMWVAPQFRVFAGIATIRFSLTSFVTSNFGGLLIGMLLGIVGGPLAVAWTRTVPPAEPPQEAGEPGERGDGGDGGDPSAPTAPAEPAADGDEARPATVDSGQGGSAGGDRPSRLPLLALALVTGFAVVAVGPASAPRAAAEEDVPVVNAAVPTMRARTVTMSGLSFGGVVPLSTKDGPVRVLKFTMDSVEMTGYSLDAPGEPGGAAPVRSTVGTLALTSNVSFYTTRMSGLLGGVLPVIFTPDLPPPLVPSDLTFTAFTSEQVFVRADTLEAEGLGTRTGTA
jgi:Family of unknown function (DUF6114)